MLPPVRRDDDALTGGGHVGVKDGSGGGGAGAFGNQVLLGSEPADGGCEVLLAHGHQPVDVSANQIERD